MQNSTLINKCINSLVDSSDALKLCDLPNCSRSFWDSQALAFSILQGSQGDHMPERDDLEFASFISAVINSDTSHIQRDIYRGLYVKYHTADICGTLSRRCTKYFNSNPVVNYSALPWRDILNTTAKLSNQIAFSLIKTCLGGWITHRRTQMPSRPCIFCKHKEDSLQHLWQCDLLWRLISLAFPPFLPFIDVPPALLGLSPPALGQIYGVHVAFLTYHALRHHNYVSSSLLFSTIQSNITKFKIAKYLISVHFGKTRSRISFSAQDPPRPSGATQTHTQTAGGSSPFPSLPSNCDRSLPYALDLATSLNPRLRFPPNRVAVLRARGLLIPSGPLFSPRLLPEPSTGTGQGAIA